MMHRPVSTHTDIGRTGWWHRLPEAWHPYVFIARLDRPIGWWLLLLPAWWSIALGAADTGRMIWLMLLFLLGAVITRAAGCIINDMWDRRLDQQVARTAQRPLAAGTLTLTQAGLFLLMLGLAGLAILTQLPQFAVIVGLAATPLVILYPLAKRVTWFPQFVLGLTFSWGIPLGWAASESGIALMSLLLLYAGTAAWIFGYDTIYAIQDMDDDRIVGVKSSALALAARLKPAIAASYGLAVLLLAAGLYSGGVGAGWPAMVGWAGLGLMALHLGWQVRRVRLDDPGLALHLFKSNRNAGLLLAFGLALTKLLGG
jgi:4-hydroxybenzoate polyprenyltransferase